MVVMRAMDKISLTDGCAVAKLGNAVMSTVCRGKVSTSSFLPMTVEQTEGSCCRQDPHKLPEERAGTK